MRQTDIYLVNQPIPNMPLLDAVIDRIEAEPERWDQGSWGDIRETAEEAEACGTTNCFAGHAVIIAGVMKMQVFKDVWRYDDEEHTSMEIRWLNEAGEEDDEVADKAREVLGLTRDEADSIFYLFTTDLNQLKVQVERVRGRAREQAAAFNRIAEELLSDPALKQYEDLLRKGWCPESREALIEALKGFKG
jgi:hypothetical protein